MSFGDGSVRKEFKEVRQAFSELRATFRAARKDGEIDPNEKAALKADTIDVLTESAELLGATAEAVTELRDLLQKRL